MQFIQQKTSESFRIRYAVNNMEQMLTTPSPQEEPSKNNEAFLKNLHDILLRAYRKAENRTNLYILVSDFASSLKEKYPDARSRRLWHLLTDSTPKSGVVMNMEDYPGEDSIVRFIEGLK